jgi:cysteinyl-tRNA synthetase
MSDDARVQAVADALFDPLGLPVERPGAMTLARIAVAALDEFDNSGDGLGIYRRQIETRVRDSIAAEVKALPTFMQNGTVYIVAKNTIRIVTGEL